MKLIEFICLILLPCLLSSCAQSTQNHTPLSIEQLDSLATEGIYAYAFAPEEALTKFIKAGQGYELQNQYEKAGDMFLNVAFLFEEKIINIDSARFYAGKSLKNHLVGSDSMKMANLYKYYGYMVGMTGDIRNGKLNIEKAKEIYKRRDFDEGIAVCNFNLARLAIKEKTYAEADSLLNAARHVWVEKGDAGRLHLIDSLKLLVDRSR